MQNFMQMKYNIRVLFQIAKEQCSIARTFPLFVALPLSINRDLVWIIFVNDAKAKRAQSTVLYLDNFLCTDLEWGYVDAKSKRLRKTSLRGGLCVSLWFNHLEAWSWWSWFLTLDNQEHITPLGAGSHLWLFLAERPNTRSLEPNSYRSIPDARGATKDYESSWVPLSSCSDSDPNCSAWGRQIHCLLSNPHIIHVTILQPYCNVSGGSGTRIWGVWGNSDLLLFQLLMGILAFGLNS